MKLRPLVLLALLLAAVLPTHAADLVGKWLAEFDSPIGLQKYIYEFKLEGAKLTGQATHDHSLGKGTVALKDIKVDGEKVSFAEPFAVEGNEILILYSGTIAGDELKLTRVVGEYGTEPLTAKRAPAQK
jgi:hypothetical protein